MRVNECRQLRPQLPSGLLPVEIHAIPDSGYIHGYVWPSPTRLTRLLDSGKKQAQPNQTQQHANITVNLIITSTRQPVSCLRHISCLAQSITNLHYTNSQQCPNNDAIKPSSQRRMLHPRHLRAKEENHRYLRQPKNLDQADTLVPAGSGSVHLRRRRRRRLLHLVPQKANLLWPKRKKYPVVPGPKTKRNASKRPSKATIRPTTGTQSPSMSKPRLRPNASRKTKK